MDALEIAVSRVYELELAIAWRKENAELRRANAILKDASVYFATELDPTRRM